MSFLIRPISKEIAPLPTPNKLVHEADRAALAVLHRATVKRVRNESDYETAIQRVLATTAYPDAVGTRAVHVRKETFMVNLNDLLPNGICTFKSCDVQVDFDEAHRVTQLNLTKFEESPDFPFEMRLPRLKKLCIYYVDLPSPDVLCSWITDRLPSLEHLEIFGACDVISPFFTEATRFPRTLRTIHISFWEIDEVEIETFLFDVWPKYQGITSLALGVEPIRSFQPIRRRLETIDQSRLFFRPGLRTLALYLNKRVDRLLDDPEEIEALCELLRKFPTVRICMSFFRLCLERSSANNLTKSPHLNFENLLNWGGRFLLEGKCRLEHLPPVSLWPLVLERLGRSPTWNEGRVEDKTDPADHASALFYFLRNGPILWGGSASNCHREEQGNPTKFPPTTSFKASEDPNPNTASSFIQCVEM